MNKHPYTEHEPTGPRLGISCADCTTATSDKGIYTIRIEDVGDDGRVIVGRLEETDEDIENLALRLEALVEAGFIDSFEITGLAVPRLTTPSSLYTEILGDFWQYPQSKTILDPKNIADFGRAWERGWRNRDAYFTRNAKAKVH